MPEELCVPLSSGWLALEWLDDSWTLAGWTSCTSEVSEPLYAIKLEDTFLDGWSFIIPITRLSRWLRRLCMLFAGLWRTGTVAYTHKDDRFLLTHWLHG